MKKKAKQHKRAMAQIKSPAKYWLVKFAPRYGRFKSAKCTVKAKTEAQAVHKISHMMRYLVSVERRIYRSYDY